MTRTTKNWTEFQDARLKMMYPAYKRADLEKAFPSRTWTAIRQRASELKVRRKRVFYGSSIRPPASELMEKLRHERERQELTARGLSKKLGYSTTLVSMWESGRARPNFLALQDWCQYLGFELTVKPTRHEARLKKAQEQSA